MDDELKIAMGDFCQSLMADPSFNMLIAGFEASKIQQILATHASDTVIREQAYADYQGVKALLQFMHELVNEKQKATTPPEPASIQDDPAVHNIYPESD